MAFLTLLNFPLLTLCHKREELELAPCHQDSHQLDHPPASPACLACHQNLRGTRHRKAHSALHPRRALSQSISLETQLCYLDLELGPCRKGVNTRLCQAQALLSVLPSSAAGIQVALIANVDRL